MDESRPALPPADHDDAHAPRALLVPVLLALGIVLTVGAIGLVFTLQENRNQEILNQLAHLKASQQEQTAPDERLKSLHESLTALEEKTARIEATLAEQSAKVDGLNNMTAATQPQLKTIAEQLETLHQSMANMANAATHRDADAPHVRRMLALKAALQTGAPFAEPLASLAKRPDWRADAAALADAAEDGITTEEGLRNELADLLATATKEPRTAATPAAHSWISRLNRQFGGMLHIAPHGATPAVRGDLSGIREHLAAHAEFTTLVEDVAALPSALQSSFTDWLEEARLRQKANALSARLDAMLLAEGSASP